MVEFNGTVVHSVIGSTLLPEPAALANAVGSPALRVALGSSVTDR